MKFGLISAFFASVAIVALAAPGAGVAAVKPSKLKAQSPDKAPDKATGKAAAKAEPAPPTHGLSGLLNAGPERVKARLGDPAIARAEGKGAFWTYRAPRCALYIFFKDEGAGLKVSGAAAGPRKRGAAYAELDACLAELEQSQGGVSP